MLVFGAAIAVGVTRLQLIALVLAIAFVLVAEMLNTAIEGVIDVSTTSFDPNAKLAKDIAAGAVLIASITAIAIGYLVFESAAGERATHVLDRVRRRAGRHHARRPRPRRLPRHRDEGVDGTRHAAARRAAVRPRRARLRRLGRGHVPRRRPAPLRRLLADADHGLLVAQTRVESGIHSTLEVAYGGALGALVTLVVFQLIG